jgi:hypothetical protein
VCWNAYTDLRDADYRPIERDQLERLLSRSGVTPETTLAQLCKGGNVVRQINVLDHPVD